MIADEILSDARSGDAVALCRAMVATPSVNPELEEGGTGEEEVGRLAASWLRAWGFEVRVDEPQPGRFNVVGTHGAGDRRLILNGHLDTVGVEGMDHDPFSAELRDGLIWGRGAADMKSGNAAALTAAFHLARDGHEGELVVALTADEEYGSVGMEALVAGDPGAHAAVVCEPTEMSVMPAHRGFVWVELNFRGRAAHGSRPDLGIDAIRHAGRFLGRLDDYEARLVEGPRHPLLGTGSVHAGTIRGGVAPPVYPEACALVMERRTLPGEAPEQVLEEFREVVDGLSAEVPDLDVKLELGLNRPGTEVPRDSELVQGLLTSIDAEGLEPRVRGMSAWVDAALLNETNTPAVCFGPGSIARAHGAEEWVEVAEVRAAARILTDFSRRFLAAG